MNWQQTHAYSADVRFDGGDLDCGNGLLLLIRRHLDPLQRGQLLEVLSTEPSVEEDLPSWSRLTGNQLVSRTRAGDQRSYLICKGTLAERGENRSESDLAREQSGGRPVSAEPVSGEPVKRVLAPAIAPLSVMGVGSWPRPRWLLRSLHEYLERRIGEEEFEQTANDAVRLAVAAQERACVDVLSDGEQRRDSYASFVGSRLDNCQLVPIVDLLPYVEDPEKFQEELKSLDVPADLVRHPAVLGLLGRSKPLAGHELAFVQTLSSKPVKVALPGPYLLTRTMWLECVSERVYEEREQLARDVVRVLREEVEALLAGGAALVQLDEPVLTEVVFGKPAHQRSFMCGALGARRDPEEELAFAGQLLREVIAGFPRERLALHICRGNWSRDEAVALSGDYTPLVPLLKTIPMGTFFLELCTPRAGELAVLRDLPEASRIGVGVVNPKTDAAEEDEAILKRAERAIDLFGPGRVLLNPDCGFATFADNPVSSAGVAEAKLAAISRVARQLRHRHGLTDPTSSTSPRIL